MRQSVAELRAERGLSQRALAKLASLHPSTIGVVEAGIVRPFPAWRRKIAAALAVPADDIEWRVGVVERERPPVPQPLTEA